MTLLLYVRHQGQLLPVDVPCDATLSTLVATVAEAVGHDDVTLSFQGSELEANSTLLADSGLSSEAVLEVAATTIRWERMSSDLTLGPDGRVVHCPARTGGTALADRNFSDCPCFTVVIESKECREKHVAVGVCDAKCDLKTAYSLQAAAGHTGIKAAFIYGDGVVGVRNVEATGGEWGPTLCRFEVGITITFTVEDGALTVKCPQADERALANAREHLKKFQLQEEIPLRPFVTVSGNPFDVSVRISAGVHV